MQRTRLSSISWKFLAIFIPTLSLAAAVILAIYAFTKLGSSQSELLANIKTLHRVHSQSVAYPLWTLDSEGLQRSLQTITTHPDIVCVSVFEMSEAKRTHWPVTCETMAAADQVYAGPIDFNSTPLGNLSLYYSASALIKQTKKEILTGALFFFLVASVAGLVAFVALKTIVGRPLGRLVKSIERAEAGDLREPVSWNSRDELGNVVRVYNSMIKQVDDNTQELIAARVEAESLAETKSRFLATMSHELRTPLNSIIGITQMLREEAYEDSLDTEPYDRVSGAGRHLQKLIDDILDFSKLEAGKIIVTREEINLELLLDDAVESIEHLAARNNNTLKLKYPESPVTLTTDPYRLRQIIINLLGNAFKFTQNGTIWLKVQENTSDFPPSVRFSVEDSGIGITPEQLPNLFEEFEQADASTTRKYGGSGLGLAISQGLCKLLGSEITVSSEPGSGSTFSFVLSSLPEAESIPPDAHARMKTSQFE